MRLLAISGSLRRASYNAGLLRAAGASLKRHGIELEIVSPSLMGALPLFNEDDEKLGHNANVAALRSQLAAADGFLFATTEYNASISACLKNAIDWGSRGGNHFNAKPCAIMGAGGYAGTTKAQAHLRDIASAINLHCLTHPEMRVEIWPKDGKGPFDAATGDVVDSSVLLRLDWQVRLASCLSLCSLPSALSPPSISSPLRLPHLTPCPPPAPVLLPPSSPDGRPGPVRGHGEGRGARQRQVPPQLTS